MFLLNNQPLPVDTPFTTADGTQYPSNFLRLSSEAEKSAIGITEVPDPVRADDRFYWSGDINLPKALEDREEIDQDGNPLFVKVYDPATESMVDTTERLVTKGLKSNFIAQVKHTAGSILAQTDWMVTRKADIGTDIPKSVVSYRASIRTKADELESAISAVTSVEELAGLDLSFPQAE
jgi:hypothetical protein